MRPKAKWPMEWKNCQTFKICSISWFNVSASSGFLNDPPRTRARLLQLTSPLAASATLEKGSFRRSVAQSISLSVKQSVLLTADRLGAALCIGKF